MQMKRTVIFLMIFFCWCSNRVLCADKPNVIVICANDLGKGMLSAYGQKYLTTPNIDMLIQNGVSFSRAYGGASTSTNSIATMLTGYNGIKKSKWHISREGVFMRKDTSFIFQNENLLNEHLNLLPENDLYLPQVFSKAGYITGEIGILEWGNTTTRQQMKLHGWDYYFGYLDHARSRGFYPPFLFENGDIVLLEDNTLTDCGLNYEPENEKNYNKRHDMNGKSVYAPDLFINKIIEFMKEFQKDPFFLMYNANLPGPVSVPQIHPEIADNESLSPIEKEYASMVKLLDEQIGKIIAELRTLGLEDNTLIVFTSYNGHEIYYQQQDGIVKPFSNKRTHEVFDNSYYKYYSDIAGDVFNGNAGLAGVKASNLEGGVTVPLTFYWKGHLNSKVSDQIVANYDFLPTMADLLNVSLKSDKDGISYLSLLQKNGKLAKKRYVVVASNDGPVLITNEGWKLRYYQRKNRYELYNLINDPQEKYDVILKNTSKAEELKKILLKECDGKIENGFLY